MLASPSVTIIIPVLNGAATIGAVLAAAQHQIDPPSDCEIMVVDNGSTDGTREIARSFGVTLLEEPQRGPSPARNRGLLAARSEVVVFLDADTIPTRRWLEALIAPFTDLAVKVTGGVAYSYKPETPAQKYMARLNRPRHSQRRIGRCTFPYVSSQNMAVRRECALAIGGWATDMPTSEDVDFCLRLSQKFGAGFVIQLDAVVLHRDRPTLVELREQAFSYGEGLADMYLRHPEVGGWGLWNSVRSILQVGVRSLNSIVLSIVAKLGLVPVARAELAAIHRQWTWSYWRGFMSMRRHHRRRAN